MENKTSKYLKYAIGEIVLVVLGILIALQINNWNENRKKQNVSIETLENLKVELQEAKSILTKVSNFNQKILKESEEFINEEYNLDSLKTNPGKVFLWANYASTGLNLPILQRELGSEKQIIGHKELIVKLRKLIIEYDQLENILLVFGEFWNGQVGPFFIKSKTMVDYNKYLSGKKLSFESVKGLLQSEDYKNLVAMANSLNIQLTLILDKLILYFDEVIAIIGSTEI